VEGYSAQKPGKKPPGVGKKNQTNSVTECLEGGRGGEQRIGGGDVLVLCGQVPRACSWAKKRELSRRRDLYKVKGGGGPVSLKGNVCEGRSPLKKKASF